LIKGKYRSAEKSRFGALTHSKAVGQVSNRRLCLRPHTCRAAARQRRVSTSVAGTASTTLTVADAPLTGSSAASASGNEGASVSLTNATFTDANPGDHTADFTATIDWGDGTAPTTGTVSYNSVTKVYTVAGSHTYAEEGTYTPTVTVKDNVDVGGTSSTTITGTATIINPEPENNVVKFNDVLPANFTPIENKS